VNSRAESSLYSFGKKIFSVDELIELFYQTGFIALTFNQTIFKALNETMKDEPVKPGYGKGSFVVICGRKGEFAMKGNNR